MSLSVCMGLERRATEAGEQRMGESGILVA